MSPQTLQSATDHVALGIPVFPIPNGTKAAHFPNWEKLATNNVAEVTRLFLANPSHTNYGLVAKAEPGGFLFFDDDGGVRGAFEAVGGKMLPTRKHQSCGGNFHYIYQHSPKSLAFQKDVGMAYISVPKPEGGELWSLRMNNSYVVGPGSVAPSHPGDEPSEYKVVFPGDIIPIPDDLLDFLIHSYKSKGTSAKAAPPSQAPAPTPKANPFAIAAQDVAEEFKDATRSLVDSGHIDEPNLQEKVIQLIELGQDDQIRPILVDSGMTETEAAEFEKQARVEQIERRDRVEDDLRQTATFRTDEAVAAKEEADRLYLENYCLKNNKRMPQSKEEIEKFARIFRKQEVAALDAKSKSKKSEYALTPIEYDEEMTKEYPVIPLVLRAGPSWDDSILYGKAGQLTRKICQYNEAHPVGVMLDLLVSLGSLFGPNPYFNVNATKHHCNEFVARIGETSRGRKGSGRDAINVFLKLIDNEWYEKKVQSGFGSGQSIVDAIQDTKTSRITDPRKGTTKDVVVPGIADKRLFIREGELSSVFVLAGQEGSTASTVLRDGWDSQPLRNVVKGKAANGISNSAVCMSPHVSISGDITVGELKSTMPSGADKNGFANRFLYVYTYRVKICPHGGPDLSLSDEIIHFYEAVQFAQKQNMVPLSSNARKLWAKMYMALEEDEPDGIVGAMIARGAAHIRRLATIIALIEKSAVVEVEHLRAAEALWDYCHDSVKFVFEKVTRDQEKILSWIERQSASGQAVTLRRVREDLYAKHKSADWVLNQIEQLVQQGKARLTDQVISLAGIVK